MEEWRRAAEESLKGAPFDKKLVTPTPEGIKLQPIYSDVSGSARVVPGFREADLLIAQEILAENPSEFNQILLAELMRGQNCVALPLDVATRRALDPGEAAAGEVGQCGLSIAALADLESALNGVDLAAAPVLAWAGSSGLPLLAMFGALAEKRRGAAWCGGVLGDPLTEWARDGALPMAVSVAFDEMAKATTWAAVHAPDVRTIGVQASLWADAGGSAVDELAFGLATGVEYLRETANRGVDIGVSAPRTLFGFTLGPVVFMQVAKLRAFRLLWAQAVAAFGGNADAQVATIHGRSTVFNKSSLDPHTNMLRASVEGFVGIVGGVDSLHVAAFDESVRVSNDFSRRIARNVAIILSEECGLIDVADPAAGSYYVETLTDELASAAWTRFQEIEAGGGMTAALRSGWPQRAVAEAAQGRFAAMASRRESLIGVNFSANPLEEPLERGPVHHEFPRRVPAQKVDEGHMKTVAEAVEGLADRASLGSVRRALRSGVAAEEAIERVQVRGLAADYERLRAAASTWTAKTGAAPRVWLANFGPPRQHAARAEFAAGFFTPGGFDVRQARGAKTVDEAVGAADAADAAVVVLCSNDETYPEIVPDFVSALRARRPDQCIILAGLPEGQVESHRAAGISDFIHLRVNCLSFLGTLQRQLGILE